MLFSLLNHQLMEVGQPGAPSQSAPSLVEEELQSPPEPALTRLLALVELTV